MTTRRIPGDPQMAPEANEDDDDDDDDYPEGGLPSTAIASNCW